MEIVLPIIGIAALMAGAFALFTAGQPAKSDATNKPVQKLPRLEGMSKTKEKPVDLAAIGVDLEAKAIIAETEALAKADELLASYEAEHHAQTNGYIFDCKRWGDFLTLFVERKANPGHWRDQDQPSKIAASLNIGNVKRVRITEGHAPDRGQSFGYTFTPVSDENGPVRSWSSGERLRDGVIYAVTPTYDGLPSWRPLLVEDEKARDCFTSYHEYQPHGYHIGRRTENYPRPAEDDVIHFDGIGQRLHVPAGMGQEIHNRIMAEIERGWGRSELPKR